MSYTLRIEERLKETIASWGIPVPVLRDFYLRAVDSLEAPTANERLEMPAADDRAGHFKHVIVVDDYSRAGRHYEFYLGIDIQPCEIWIVQCDCWLVDRDGNIVWMSDQ